MLFTAVWWRRSTLAVRGPIAAYLTVADPNSARTVLREELRRRERDAEWADDSGKPDGEAAKCAITGVHGGESRGESVDGSLLAISRTRGPLSRRRSPHSQTASARFSGCASKSECRTPKSAQAARCR